MVTLIRICCIYGGAGVNQAGLTNVLEGRNFFEGKARLAVGNATLEGRYIFEERLVGGNDF